MDDQLRNFLAGLSNEKTAEAKPWEHAADDEVQQALAICNGDAIAALRITLIANAFLEAQLEEYFSGLFDRLDELPNVHFFVDGVQQGHAALTVHPRGEIETDRAIPNRFGFSNLGVIDAMVRAAFVP